MLTELRTFIAVVRYGSFSRAGENIGLTQGAVSGQIQRLEQQTGLSLFDRSGRKAILTATGREAYSRAEDIVAAIAQLGSLSHAGDTQGALVIGAITTVQQSWLINALYFFRLEFPNITVRVIPGASLNILGQVDAGEIDMAIMVRPPYVLPAEVQWHTIMREPFVTLVPATFPSDDWREALATLPFIRYDRASFGGRVIDIFLRKQQIIVQEALEMDEIGGLICAVERSMGAALVPTTEGHLPFSEKVRALPIGHDTSLFREIGIAERSIHKHPEITNRLVTLLQICATTKFSNVLQQLDKDSY